MIDLKLIRENPEMVRANCVRRGFPIDIDGLVKLDGDARALTQEIETLRAANVNLQNQLNMANLAASQTAQTAQIIAALSPTA